MGLVSRRFDERFTVHKIVNASQNFSFQKKHPCEMQHSTKRTKTSNLTFRANVSQTLVSVGSSLKYWSFCGVVLRYSLGFYGEIQKAREHFPLIALQVHVVVLVKAYSVTVTRAMDIWTHSRPGSPKASPWNVHFLSCSILDFLPHYERHFRLFLSL